MSSREKAREVPHFVLVVCCVLAAWASFVAPRAVDAKEPLPMRDAGPSRVIYPTQVLPLRFSHAKHVKTLALPCASCHGAATTSTRSRDRLLPPATRCDGCHGTDHRELSNVTREEGNRLGECASCHVGFDPASKVPVARVVIPEPNLKFDHRAHVVRNITCERCHGDVGALDLATRDNLPRMRSCLDCHRGTGPRFQDPGASGAQGPSRSVPSAACSTCHLTEAGTRLKTRFAAGLLLPRRWLRDSEHGADWLERHRSIAANDSRFCGNCHAERECVDCHDGRVRPRGVHPNDFLSMHAVSARQDGASCQSCHRQQSFCLTCHQRSGVVMSGPFDNLRGRGRFHPPKQTWTDGPRSRRHHATEAQRNLNACTSCHTERDCAICHATRRVGGAGGGLLDGLSRGVSPHPPSFRNRCAGALRKNARSCVFCHGRDDPAFLSCR